MEGTFKNEVEVDVPVKSATTLGQGIYLATLKNTEDKIRITKSKSKLKKMTWERIYIDNDRTFKEQQILKSIREKTAEKGREEAT